MRRRPISCFRPAPRLITALLCGVALLPATAGAADVPLYQVQVPLAGAAEADRAAGFALALQAVAVRVSGRGEAATNATIAAADPTRYVQRYSTTADRRLSVGFDSRAVSGLLQQAGLPFWAAERPLTLVEAPGGDRAEGERAAQWRGLPVQWTDAAPPREPAAARASLRGVPNGAGYDWTFSHAGQTVQGRGSLADGINLAADTLAARYAPPSSRGNSTLALRIAGVGDLRAYAGLLTYLGRLSIVREASVDALEGELLRLKVTMRGDRELLGRIAAMDGRLQPATTDPGAPDAGADFLYQP
jgi:hypothetical protein